MTNLPLLDIQSFQQHRRIEDLRQLLDGSPLARPSWLQGQNGEAVVLFQPSTVVLTKIFPSMKYRRVMLNDAESGLLDHFPSNMYAFPSKRNSFFCAAKIPVAISDMGKEQLQAAFKDSPAGEDSLALLATRRATTTEEKDPTLTLIQFFLGEGNKLMMKETVIDTEPRPAVSCSHSICGRVVRTHNYTQKFWMFRGTWRRFDWGLCFWSAVVPLLVCRWLGWLCFAPLHSFLWFGLYLFAACMEWGKPGKLQ